MSISIRRARRRAKDMAASSGLTHQQALDAVAASQGYSTWSVMLAASPETGRRKDPTGKPSTGTAEDLADPLRASVLGRSSGIRDAVCAFMVDAVSQSSDPQHNPLARAVGAVLVHARAAAVMGEPSGLDLSGPSFTQALSRIVSSWVDQSARMAEEALKTGGFHSGSWADQAARGMASAAREASLPPGVVSRIEMATTAGIVDTLEKLEGRISLFEGSPEEAFSMHHRHALPDDVLAAAARRRGQGLVLSEWEAGVTERILSGEDGMMAPSKAVAQAVHTMSILFHTAPDNRSDLVRAAFDIVPGDAGRRFARGSALPAGDDITSRWIRDVVQKSGEGRRPFSYNPFMRLHGYGEKAPLSIAAEAAVMIAAPEGSPVEQRMYAARLMETVALICSHVGDRGQEIGVRAGQGACARSIRDVLISSRGAMSGLALFAELHGVSPVEGLDARVEWIDEAARDPSITDLAIRSISPFAHFENG